MYSGDCIFPDESTEHKFTFERFIIFLAGRFIYVDNCSILFIFRLRGLFMWIIAVLLFIFRLCDGFETCDVDRDPASHYQTSRKFPSRSLKKVRI